VKLAPKVSVISDAARQIESTIRRSARYLDEEQFAEWQRLFLPEAQYRIFAYSHELRKEMCWLDLGMGELAWRMNNADRFVRDRCEKTRFVDIVEIQVGENEATTYSNVQIWTTDLEGQTSLYALVSYSDALVERDNEWLISNRAVRVRTRILSAGSHIPV